MIPDLQRNVPFTQPRSKLSSVGLLLALLPIACAHEAPPPSPPTAPPDIVSRVTAAKTIFLSNAGANDAFRYEIPGGPNVGYNELYAAIKQWGYLQLVDSPAHADLVFQLRGTELIPDLENTFSGHVIAKQHEPKLELTILDPHSDSSNPTALDTLTVVAGRSTDVPKGAIAFAQSIEVLTYQISTLVAVPHPSSGKLISRDAFRPSFESIINFTGPVPPRVLSAKNVFVVNDAPNRAAYFQGFVTALTNWGHYHLADAAQGADVVFHFHDDQANGTFITIEDPSTHIVLWTIADPHFGFYRQTGAHRVAALNQNFISLLKQLNGIQLSPDEISSLH